MLNALVVGAGIGGLASAIALANGGHRVSVLERAPQFSELGAGIQLAPNAFHALQQLGIDAEVHERAVYPDQLRLAAAHNDDIIIEIPLKGDYLQRFRHPYAVVHRADLYEALLAKCHAHESISLTPSTKVVAYKHEGDNVFAFSADGARSQAGDLLVGADGIRSSIRQQLVCDGPPQISGHTIYRSIISILEAPLWVRSPCVTIWAGPGSHFVCYPVAGGDQLNMAAVIDNKATTMTVAEPVERQRVQREFVQFNPAVRELIALGRQWRSWVLCDRPPIDIWSDNRVVLLGDAAHPMLQYAAQGACMALEDAVSLGAAMDSTASRDVSAGLDRYVEARRGRTALAQNVSREMGERIYHASGPYARQRDRELSAMTLADTLDRLSPLHEPVNVDAVR